MILTSKELEEISRIERAATKANTWFAHRGGDCYGNRATVRGPFFRWFEVREVDPQYQKHVAEAYDDAQYAACAMNSVPALLETVRELTEMLEKAEAAFVDAQSQFYRIETADWCAEQMRLGAKSGGHGVKRIIAEIERRKGEGK